MEASVNLCDYPWIPVAGQKERKSLLQVFSDLSLRRLSGNPVDKIVILRLLLCIAHASNKIPDEEAWLALTPEILGKNAVTYLKEHYDEFFLYGDKPFLQFPQLKKLSKDGKSVRTLFFSDNQSILTNWDCQKDFSEAEKIVFLLRSACFSLTANLKFDNKIKLSKDVIKKPVAQVGTLLGNKGYLHAYILGENIIDTLKMNLLTKNEIKSINVFSAGLGKPFWEQMPTEENDAIANNYKRSYLGTLFPIDKFIMYSGNQVIKTDGIPYSGLLNYVCDPALTIHQNGNNIYTAWASTSRRPWRELTALLSFLDGNGGFTPYFLSMGFPKIRKSVDINKTITIWTGGMEVSKTTMGQKVAEKNDYVESENTLPIVLLDKNGYFIFKKMMEDAEKKSKQLKTCVAEYYKNMIIDSTSKDSQKGKHEAENSSMRYWELMESRAQTILELAFSDTTPAQRQEEQRKWFKFICDVYDEKCPHGTARQLAAWVKANPRFITKDKKKQGENK